MLVKYSGGMGGFLPRSLYKPSVISSFDPPKMEKRWRYYHIFDFFGPIKKIVMGSIPGAVRVLFFAYSTIHGGTIIEIDLSWGFLAIKDANLGDCKKLTRKDNPKKLWIRVDLNPRSLDNRADALQSEPPWKRVSREKKARIYFELKPQNSNCILHSFFQLFDSTSFKFYCAITF